MARERTNIADCRCETVTQIRLKGWIEPLHVWCPEIVCYAIETWGSVRVRKASVREEVVEAVLKRDPVGKAPIAVDTGHIARVCDGSSVNQGTVQTQVWRKPCALKASIVEPISRPDDGAIVELVRYADTWPPV